ncbi:hypothetical protein ACFY8F_35415 [Streptomyces tanashiensis]|uniref:hypothetical protein n=1 Tax=Streptomyces tanashiensis TaxID=67367 RepID=UPI00367A231D
MRSILFPRPLLTVAVGSVVVLAAVGTQSAYAATGHASAAGAASVVSARASVVHADSGSSAVRTARAVRVVPGVREAEARFLELADLIAQSCEPNVLSAAGHVVATPTPDTTLPVLVDPVPLNLAEGCAAQRHQARISRAFSGKETGTYEKLRERLAILKYPGARIHRMPNFAGRPVVRLDLRVGADRLALEVTDLGGCVMVQAFGAPQDVSVTEVRLKQELALPTS